MHKYHAIVSFFYRFLLTGTDFCIIIIIVLYVRIRNINTRFVVSFLLFYTKIWFHLLYSCTRDQLADPGFFCPDGASLTSFAEKYPQMRGRTIDFF